LRPQVAAGALLLASLCVVATPSAGAEESKDTAGAEPPPGEMFSLTRAVPEFLYTLNNFPTYYGARPA